MSTYRHVGQDGSLTLVVRDGARRLVELILGRPPAPWAERAAAEHADHSNRHSESTKRRLLEEADKRRGARKEAAEERAHADELAKILEDAIEELRAEGYDVTEEEAALAHHHKRREAE